MFDANRESKTICALASGSGSGAISVIRLSGPDSFQIIKKACPSLITKSLESHKVYLSKFFSIKNIFIDQILVTCFKHGHSYTGEECVEISCHGSTHIVNRILESLVTYGAVTAEKGEFTYRAFMNDKLDLVQAEAVLSVIQSQSDSALKMSLRQLEGHVSNSFNKIEDELTWSLAHIEASIDFSTEGIDVVDPLVLIEKLTSIEAGLNKLTRSYETGRLVKDGVKLVLAGQPNVGKSSLLNKLVLEDKAIVTNIAGTTRDVVESSTLFNGQKFNISDTAGLRETTDVVEQIGVQKSKREIQNSDLTLFVFDLSVGLSESDLMQLSAVSGRVLLVANKSDLVKKLSSDTLEIYSQKIIDTHKNITIVGVVPVSALDVSVRDTILLKVSEVFIQAEYSDEAIISSTRQFEYSSQALAMISQSIGELTNGLGSEYVAQTLKQALVNIQRVLGKDYDDQIMDRVFKEFCLGK